MSSLPESLLRFRTELEDAIHCELEAQATAPSNGRGARTLRAVRRRPGRTALALGAVAAAAAAALFVSSPWRSAPGFLERAQAALTPPPGSILHMKWEETTRACTGTSAFEVWIDQAPPHTYRAFVPRRPTAPPDPGEPCSTGAPIEIGGSDEEPTLSFVPPNTLAPSQRFFFAVEPDPWAAVRTDIKEGRAHREGTTQLDGRTVERVRFDCERCPTNYGYFDPESLYPVAWDFGNGHVWRYLTWEYLPRTEDSLALTAIRAQHPDATGP